MVPVPDDLVITTVDPPDVRLFPFASLACTVKTCVELPLAIMLALVGVRVERDALAVPVEAYKYPVTPAVKLLLSLFVAVDEVLPQVPAACKLPVNLRF